VTLLLLLLLGAILVPLFVATWRTSLLGLALQGVLMFAVARRWAPEAGLHDGMVAFIDHVLVRGLAIPLALHAALAAERVPARNDVIAPHLFSWILAVGLVLLAYTLSERLVPAGGDEQALVAVAAAGVLLGFLVLASDSGPFSQMVGVLRVENGVALLELSSGHHSSVLIQLGLTAVLVATVALFCWYLTRMGARAPEAPPVDTDGSTL
jgi:hydrogenase-4 component E